jgi:hypothetical protein
MTIGEALDAFEDEWIESLAFTPHTSYRRTLRLFRMELGDRVEQPLETLKPDDLRAFVLWHRAHSLADSAEGTRKAAVHIARLGEFLSEQYGMPDLAIPRDDLRALAPDEEPAA